MARRPELPAIPVALAQLEQQELRQGQVRPNELTEGQIYEKEESIIRSYQRAIDLGQRSSAIVRKTVKLLFKHKRGNEALDLVNSIPVASQLASDLGRQALLFAVENRDFQRAEEIAANAVKAKPADLQERVLLVQILLNRGRLAEAETVIREAVNLSRADSDRWILLVQFLVLTKQQAKAAQAVNDAEAALPREQAPLALAQCCFQIGKSYEGSNEGLMKRWHDRAKEVVRKGRRRSPRRHDGRSAPHGVLCSDKADG